MAILPINISECLEEIPNAAHWLSLLDPTGLFAPAEAEASPMKIPAKWLLTPRAKELYEDFFQRAVQKGQHMVPGSVERSYAYFPRQSRTPQHLPVLTSPRKELYANLMQHLRERGRNLISSSPSLSKHDIDALKQALANKIKDALVEYYDDFSTLIPTRQGFKFPTFESTINPHGIRSIIRDPDNRLEDLINTITRRAHFTHYLHQLAQENLDNPPAKLFRPVPYYDRVFADISPFLNELVTQSVKSKPPNIWTTLHSTLNEVLSPPYVVHHLAENDSMRLLPFLLRPYTEETTITRYLEDVLLPIINTQFPRKKASTLKDIAAEIGYSKLLTDEIQRLSGNTRQLSKVLENVGTTPQVIAKYLDSLYENATKPTTTPFADAVQYILKTAPPTTKLTPQAIKQLYPDIAQRYEKELKTLLQNKRDLRTIELPNPAVTRRPSKYRYDIITTETYNRYGTLPSGTAEGGIGPPTYFRIYAQPSELYKDMKQVADVRDPFGRLLLDDETLAKFQIHSTVNNPKLPTLGWIKTQRLGNDILYIDEIQSDMLGELTKIVEHLKSHLPKETLTSIKSILNKYDDWASEGLATVLSHARKNGIREVHIVDPNKLRAHWKDLLSPVKAHELYDKLPRKFGFKVRGLTEEQLPIMSEWLPSQKSFLTNTKMRVPVLILTADETIEKDKP